MIRLILAALLLAFPVSAHESEDPYPGTTCYVLVAPQTGAHMGLSEAPGGGLFGDSPRLLIVEVRSSYFVGVSYRTGVLEITTRDGRSFGLNAGEWYSYSCDAPGSSPAPSSTPPPAVP